MLPRGLKAVRQVSSQMFFLLRLRIRRPLRILICFGILLIFCVVVFFLLLGQALRSFATVSTPKLTQAEGAAAVEAFEAEVPEDVLSVSLLGEPKDIQYYHYENISAFSGNLSYYLIGQYHTEDYATQKQQLDTAYTFQAFESLQRPSDCSEGRCFLL